MQISSSKSLIRNSIFLCVLILLLFSCAQIVSPGGGKKDKTPPRVVKYTPDSAQINFNSKSIAITFDEFVQLKDLNSQLIISPPVKTTPDITIKNKTMNIVFDKKDTLKPNTTYSISFGNAIQDITENNALENFKYIFSTGTFIDSLYLKGKVENSFNHTTEKGILVMLFKEMNDSVVYKKLPDYFAKTKEDGTFQINNVRQGTYKLFALKDGNTNYKYDEGEMIGFVDAPIDVSEKKNILIDMFQEPGKKVYLKKATYDSYGKIVFAFNKPTDSIRVEPINYTFKEGDVINDFSPNKDTLTYWFRNIDKDILKLQLRNGTRIIDTLEYKLITKEEALKSRKGKLHFNLLNNFNGNQNFDLNAEVRLNFSQPIMNVSDSTIVHFKEDTIPYSLKNKLVIRAINTSIVVKSSALLKSAGASAELPFINPKLKESTNYHLFFAPKTFTDFFGLTNDSIKIDFKTREEKFYGSLKLKLAVPKTKGKYIIQLMDIKDNIVREDVTNTLAVFNYQYLYPQQYKLKIIVDDNANGKWDTGNYLQKTQPEKVIYDSELINLRSNWDSELEWNVNLN